MSPAQSHAEPCPPLCPHPLSGLPQQEQPDRSLMSPAHAEPGPPNHVLLSVL
jgi:hypothetical protein